jgi:hypothetical protein
LLRVYFALSLMRGSRSGFPPPPNRATPSPPPGYVVSFVSFHERGFGVPASRFMWAILHNYGVELHNFSPNSISQAAIFVAVCEGYLGIDHHWDLWTHFFSAELFASPTGERRVRSAVRAGGCILQLRQSRASQYIPAVLASSNKGWQRGGSISGMTTRGSRRFLSEWSPSPPMLGATGPHTTDRRISSPFSRPWRHCGKEGSPLRE